MTDFASPSITVTVPATGSITTGPLPQSATVFRSFSSAQRNVAFVARAVADADRRAGWSVVVRGTLAEITDPAHLERLRTLPLYPCPWAPEEKARYVGVLPHMVTGRRIRIPDDLPFTWWG